MKNDIFQKEYSNLNKSQKEAVDNIYWPVMVVAWPGTWKTQIIWLRTANIILNTWVSPSNILITTFTDAWVIAIKQRLEYFLWSDGYKVNVSTIHSFCQDVIRTFPEKFVEFKASKIIDDIESYEILKDILDTQISSWKIKALKTDNDRFFYLRDIKSRIWTLKQEWINKNSFFSHIKELEQTYIEELSQIKSTLQKYQKTKEKNENHIQKLIDLNHIFDLYNSYLFQNWYYDFSDMINFVLQKFLIDQDLAYFYAEKYQFIMLDEFQDTNNPQNTIINTILNISRDNEFKNIMIVWDDDQSIYRFQWANIENMLDFASLYNDLKVIVLENNYRSTQQILDLCTLSISHNNQRLTNKISWINKKLISSNPKYKILDISPKICFLTSKEEEYIYLLNQIKEKLKHTKEEEIAIIVRNNFEVEFLSNYFIKNWINVVSKLNTNILKNDYIIFIIDFLKLLVNDNLSDDIVIDIFRNSILWLNQVDIFRINKYLYNINYNLKYKKTFLDTVFDIDNIDLPFVWKDKIKEFLDIFNSLKQDLNSLNFVEFFDNFLQKLKIIDYVELKGNFDDIQDIYTIFNKIKSFIELDKDFNLTKFLWKIDLYKFYNYPIPRQNTKKTEKWINIMTAHSSKWLEYEIVFVSWLYNTNWEAKRIIDKLKLPKNLLSMTSNTEVDSIEEDRRLFFVACSRAKKELFLSTPTQDWGKTLLVSSFVLEVQDLCEKIEFSSKEEDLIDFLKTTMISNKNHNYDFGEIDYIKEFLSNYKLSPTDLNTFLEDPKLFLRNVVFKYPFIDNEATIFWKVYHRVLELFYLRYKNSQKLDEYSYLKFTFTALLEKEVLSPESFEKLLEKWLSWLKWFYDIYSQLPKIILELEYNFRPKNIVFNWVSLTWKIDKIELITDSFSSNNLDNVSWQLAFFKQDVILIDYKTWKIKTIKEIRWEDKDWNKKEWWGKYFRQLMFYKLLCELDSDFISKYNVSWLALDFVEWKDGEYKIVKLDYDNSDFEYFKNELIDSWNKINDLDFWKDILS